MTRLTGPPGAQYHPDKNDHQRRQPRQRQQPPAPIRSSAAICRSVTHLRVLAHEGEISLTAHDHLLETPDASEAGMLGCLLGHALVPSPGHGVGRDLPLLSHGQHQQPCSGLWVGSGRVDQRYRAAAAPTWSRWRPCKTWFALIREVTHRAVWQERIQVTQAHSRHPAPTCLVLSGGLSHPRLIEQ
jgi:hypothetical protein